MHPTTRSLRQRISQSWPATVLLDALYRRDDVWIATTPAERDAVFRLRHAVYAEEQGDTGGHIDHGRFIAPGDHDPECILIGCGPRHAPEATVRVHTWEPGCVPPDYARNHALRRFEGIDRLRVSHVGYLMLKPSLRSSLRGLGFVLGAMELAGRTARPDILFAHAAPGLLARYERFGFRTYGAPVFSSTRGPEVPLCITADRAWLRASASLWAPVILQLVDEGVIAESPTRLRSPFETADRPSDPERLREAWQRPHALSALSLDASRAVLRHARRFEVRPGVCLHIEGFVEKDLILVVDGTVRRERGQRVVDHKGPGSLLGVEAWMEPGSRHRHTVRTVTGATILTLSGRRLRKLCARHPILSAELGALLDHRRPATPTAPSSLPPEVSLV